MATKRRRDERTRGAAGGHAGRRGREDAPREATHPREEEGYSQPESSAQKTPPRPAEGPPGHPE
jgi:hypothetical protein